MDDSTDTRDARYTNLGYNISIMGSDTVTEIYNRQSTSQLQSRSGVGGAVITSDTVETSGSLNTGNINLISHSNTSNDPVITVQRGLKRTSNELCYNDSPNEARQMVSQSSSLITRDCINDNCEESFTNLGPSKRSPPSNGKKTKGRVKIKMEYIDNKLRRYTTFSKRKTGIMKKVQNSCFYFNYPRVSVLVPNYHPVPNNFSCSINFITYYNFLNCIKLKKLVTGTFILQSVGYWYILSTQSIFI